MQDPKTHDVDWNDLRYVLVLSRKGVMAAAAAALRVNETTVARRLARVEKMLGGRLFVRTEGRWLPTELGQLVVQRAERMEAEAFDLKFAAAGADAHISGVVRLTTTPLLMNWLLLPALPKLLAEHPALQLNLIADPRNLSLTRGEADIALRPARPAQELRAIARRIGHLDYAAYAAATSRAKELPWIVHSLEEPTTEPAQWLSKAMRNDPAARPPLVVNDSDIGLRAACLGLGRYILPRRIGDAETALVRLREAGSVFARELWLIVHPELRRLGRIRAVIEWLERVAA